MTCSSCRKTFTRARHYNSHRCLGSDGDYVDLTNWPIKNEVVTDQSDDDEDGDATYRPGVESGGEQEQEEEEVEEDSNAEYAFSFVQCLYCEIYWHSLMLHFFY